MKLDAITIGAGAFAAFAAYAYMKTSKASTTPAKTGAAVAFDSATSQRQQVGAATAQNLDYLGYTNDAYMPNLPGMGGGQGLYTPSKGFWAI